MELTGWTERELMETSYETVRRYEFYLPLVHVARNGGELNLKHLYCETCQARPCEC